MALRNARPYIFEPKGLSDAIDATTAFKGAMTSLQNLAPNPANDRQFVPRPASTQISSFAGFSSPGVANALLVIGDFAWGMVPTSRFAGKDEPFCYNIKTGAFVTISNVTSANTPTSPATTGDWTPPMMVSATAGRITISHPGYNGTTTFIGWIDFSSFSSNTITGTTHTSTLLDGLSANVLQAGWQIGMAIAGPDIPASTFIAAIAANGLSVTLSQAATGSHAGGTYTVTGGTPAAPIYGAGNTNGQALTSVALAVGAFNDRAWYAVGNAAVFSDTGAPQQITNANQALILGDNTPVTAFAGLPLTQALTGGTVQSFIVFKGAGSFYQITGDAATANLQQSVVNGSVGTLAPNTIVATPRGIAFIAPDGLRELNFSGVQSPPIGAAGSGVHVPFLSALNPSRMCAAYNNNVLRITCNPALAPGGAAQEFWLDYDRGIWTGPHTFPAALIEAYRGGTGVTFIHAASGVPAALWQSNTDALATSSYTENGVMLTCVFQPVLLPDGTDMHANAINETTIGLQLPSGQQVSFVMMDEYGDILNQGTIAGPVLAGGIWDSMTWGIGRWGPPYTPYRQTPIPLSEPVVTRQLSVAFTTAAAANLVFGTFQLRYQRLGYQLP